MKDPKTFRNILVVRTDRIGDVVLTTPAIKALREEYPGARISILVTPATWDLVYGNPYIDEILVDDRSLQHKGIFGFWRLAREIRTKQFDLAIIYHTKRRYNLACYFGGISYRLGYKNEKFGFLLSNPVNDPRVSGNKHEAEHCLDLLKIIGINKEEMDMFVPLQKDAEDWADNWLKEHNLRSYEFITIHPGASDITKCWPKANFAQLMDKLTERYAFKIVLIGSIQTSPVASEILRQTRVSQFIDLTGKTTLAQTVSLLRRTCLLISNDSGPVHVAAGLGVNVISLFLRDQPGINAKRWRPLGPKSYILSNSPGEAIKLNAKGNAIAGQAGSISVDNVMELIEQIFQRDNQYEIF